MGLSAKQKEFHRRSIRLPKADYSSPGAYFITICSAHHSNTFGGIEAGQTVLSPLGKIVQSCWTRIPEHFPIARIEEFIVMPNHLHGIIALTVGARYIVPSPKRTLGTEQFQKPVAASIPTIVRTFKAAVTREACMALQWTRGIWQRNYFERVLRDGKEYADASRYILENPKRWEWDKENAQRKMASTGRR